MTYPNVTPAVFLERPNRFIARVAVDGRTETVHVKNTGRCRELLRPGAEIWLTAPGTPGRKTAYELIRAKEEGFHAALAFVIQTEGVTEVRPNEATDPAFARAFAAARQAGVTILFLPCRVTPEELTVLAGDL